MQCDRVQPLVPVYIDGELREELARPMRQHLLECQACRDIVAETKSLSSWFVPTPEVAVPEGFAASVARRAFAGATGGDHVLVPAIAPAGSTEGAGRVIDGAQRFAMNLVGVAAAALAVLTLWLASDESQWLSGGALNATPTEQDARERLEELNAEGAASEQAAEEDEAQSTTGDTEESGR